MSVTFKQKLDLERDLKAEEQGNNHANPIIRSMYPSTSRSQMAAQFAQLYSLGWNQAVETVLRLLSESSEGFSLSETIEAFKAKSQPKHTPCQNWTMGAEWRNDQLSPVIAALKLRVQELEDELRPKKSFKVENSWYAEEDEEAKSDYPNFEMEDDDLRGQG